jgi:DNA-binding MarR family transcriptional regulator
MPRPDGDPADRRARRLVLTRAGRDVLRAAIPAWQRTHAELDRSLAGALSALGRHAAFAAQLAACRNFSASQSSNSASCAAVR